MKRSRGEILQYVIAGVVVFLPLLAEMLLTQSDTPWGYDLLAFSGFWCVLVAVMIFFHLSRWWLTPLLLSSFIHSGFVFATGYDVGYHAISAMYDTNLQEAVEFVRSPMILTTLTVGGPFFLVLVYLLLCKWKWSWAARPVAVSSRRLAVLAVLGGVCLTTWKALGNDFANVYPIRLACQNIDYFTEVILVRRKYDDVEYVYQGDPVGPESETYILVLGESARKMNWGLYGYDRATTPEIRDWLEQYPGNTVLFTRAVASGRVTRVSLPSLFSVSNARDYPVFYNYPSVIRVFRQAGYKTFVASAQPPTGYYEGLPNMILRDAEVVTYLHHRRIYFPLDEQLLPVLEEFLEDPAPKKLIVLHTQGSHLRYDERYPKHFERFRGKGEPVDSYDNSICYTDWFLRQVFERVKGIDAPAAVLYMSDHGENLNDHGDKNFSHGIKGITRYEIHIPAVFYFNDSFVRQRRRTVETVHAHKDKLITHDMIAHTFMGMGGVHDPNVYQPAYDVASPQFGPGELYFADDMRTLVPLSELLRRTDLDAAPQAPMPQPNR